MPTPLSYTLGLATGGFLGPLAGATRGLAAFLGVTASVGGVVAGVWAEISRGGALTDLSHRTGESVKDLFQLQYAFEQSGVEASAVAPLLQRYRQSLAGIGEGGESTAEAFQAIGLSIQDLKALDAPQALEKIMAALSSADRNQAAGVANAIFGRGASGNILQIARDGSAFADALKETAAQSAQMQRMAGIFDSIGDTITSLRVQVRGFFLDVAEGVAPAIQGLLVSLKGHDWETFGQLAGLSLTIGFKSALNILSAGLQRIFAAVPGMFAGVVNLGAGGIASKLADVIQAGPAGKALVGMLFPALTTLLMNNGDGVSDAFKKLADYFDETGQGLISDAIKAAATLDTVNIADATAEKAKLAAIVAKLGGQPGAPVPGVAAGNLTNAVGGGANSLLGGNALERVGALFGSGAGSSLNDSARQTAGNTRETARAIHTVNATLQRMENQSRGNFANV